MTNYHEDDDYIEINPIFEGTCTCEHEPEQHGWGSCDVVFQPGGTAGQMLLECQCEAGWVE